MTLLLLPTLVDDDWFSSLSPDGPYSQVLAARMDDVATLSESTVIAILADTRQDNVDQSHDDESPVTRLQGILESLLMTAMDESASATKRRTSWTRSQMLFGMIEDALSQEDTARMSSGDGGDNEVEPATTLLLPPIPATAAISSKAPKEYVAQPLVATEIANRKTAEQVLEATAPHVTGLDDTQAESTSKSSVTVTAATTAAATIELEPSRQQGGLLDMAVHVNHLEPVDETCPLGQAVQLPIDAPVVNVAVAVDETHENLLDLAGINETKDVPRDDADESVSRLPTGSTPTEPTSALTQHVSATSNPTILAESTEQVDLLDFSEIVATDTANETTADPLSNVNPQNPTAGESLTKIMAHDESTSPTLVPSDTVVDPQPMVLLDLSGIEKVEATDQLKHLGVHPGPNAAMLQEESQKSTPDCSTGLEPEMARRPNSPDAMDTSDNESVPSEPVAGQGSITSGTLPPTKLFTTKLHGSGPNSYTVPALTASRNSANETSEVIDSLSTTGRKRGRSLDAMDTSDDKSGQQHKSASSARENNTQSHYTRFQNHTRAVDSNKSRWQRSGNKTVRNGTPKTVASKGPATRKSPQRTAAQRPNTFTNKTKPRDPPATAQRKQAQRFIVRRPDTSTAASPRPPKQNDVTRRNPPQRIVVQRPNSGNGTEISHYPPRPSRRHPPQGPFVQRQGGAIVANQSPGRKRGRRR